MEVLPFTKVAPRLSGPRRPSARCSERRKLLKEMAEKLEHANTLLEEVNDVGSKVVL